MGSMIYKSFRARARARARARLLRNERQLQDDPYLLRLRSVILGLIESRVGRGLGHGRLLQNSAVPNLDGEPHAGRRVILAGHGNTRSGGVDIPVCPNAMTDQRLEHNPGRQECLPHRVLQQPHGHRHDKTQEQQSLKSSPPASPVDQTGFSPRWRRPVD